MERKVTCFPRLAEYPDTTYISKIRTALTCLIELITTRLQYWYNATTTEWYEYGKRSHGDAAYFYQWHLVSPDKQRSTFLGVQLALRLRWHQYPLLQINLLNWHQQSCWLLNKKPKIARSMGIVRKIHVSTKRCPSMEIITTIIITPSFK